MWFTIEWAPEAENQFYKVLDFWANNNGDSSYSQKIYSEVEKIEQLLSANPYIGQILNINIAHYNIRRIVVLSHFSILYTVKNTIQIVSFWDNRQDPNDLSLIIE